MFKLSRDSIIKMLCILVLLSIIIYIIQNNYMNRMRMNFDDRDYINSISREDDDFRLKCASVYNRNKDKIWKDASIITDTDRNLYKAEIGNMESSDDIITRWKVVKVCERIEDAVKAGETLQDYR